MDGFVNQGYSSYKQSDDTKLNSQDSVFNVSTEFQSTIQNPSRISETHQKHKEADTNNDREVWNNGIEFLMSCIALSVGLGNVWRFPFAALENGGGAFLVPYIIVLFLVGKPVYYLEMLLGQFSSRSSIKIFELSPIMKGVGYGQVLSTSMATTYYASLNALTLRFFFSSFQSVLPWSYCRPEWNKPCIDSSSKNIIHNETIGRVSTSAELYFYKEILNEKDTIHDGIGYPNWILVCCLAFSWILVYLIVIKGIKSSGRFSYALAIFPYFIMLILLFRAVTLPGAVDGILYFITPQFGELLNPKVWYAAVSQVFFSLAICFGGIVMYSSFNRFSHNIYRDALIVTSLDTGTSILAGLIIFGVLGNLAHESGTKDIKSVVSGGVGLAFVSYPDAIAKFDFVPQLFAVLFFFMLFVLGIGTNVGMVSCTMTCIKDQWKKLDHWKVGLIIAVAEFAIGTIYLTPGGQYMVNFVDFFGASFIAFVLGIVELITFGWIYGVKRICQDIEFMLGIKTGLYWRICWSIITPGMMIAILTYHMAMYEPLTYKGYVYPDLAYAIGWLISACAILQLPIWATYAVYKQPGIGFKEKFLTAFRPKKNWGPANCEINKKYMEYRDEKQPNIFTKQGFIYKIKDNIFG